MRRTAFSIALAAEMFVMTGAATAQPPSPTPPVPPTNPDPKSPGVVPPGRTIDSAERDKMRKEWESVKKEWDQLSAEQRLLSVVHAKNVEEVELGRIAQTKGTDQAVKDFAAMMVKEHTEGDGKLTSLALSESITVWDPARTQRVMLLKKMFDKDREKDKAPGDKPREGDKHRDNEKPGTTTTTGTPMSDPEANEPQPRDRNERKAEPNDRWIPTEPAVKLRALSGEEFDRAYSRMMYLGHSDLLAKLEKGRADVTNERVKTFVGEAITMVRHHRDEAAKLPGASQGPKRDEKPKTPADPAPKDPAMKDPRWDR